MLASPSLECPYTNNLVMHLKLSLDMAAGYKIAATMLHRPTFSVLLFRNLRMVRHKILTRIIREVNESRFTATSSVCGALKLNSYLSRLKNST